MSKFLSSSLPSSSLLRLLRQEPLNTAWDATVVSDGKGQRGYFKLNATTNSIASSRASSRPIASGSPAPSRNTSICRVADSYRGHAIVRFDAEPEAPFGSSVATNWMM